MSRIARQLKRGTPGFSLIEITVVTVIIVVLAIAGLPYYSRTIQRSRLSGGVSQILGDLRQSQSAAIAQGRMYRLLAGTDASVNPSKPNQYCLQSSTDAGATWAPATTACLWVDIPTRYPGVGFTMQDGAGPPATVHQVQFNSRGIASHPSSPTFPITITVTGQVGGQTTTRLIQILRAGGTKTS